MQCSSILFKLTTELWIEGIIWSGMNSMAIVVMEVCFFWLRVMAAWNIYMDSYLHIKKYQEWWID